LSASPVRCARPWSTLLLQPKAAGPECACHKIVLGERRVPIADVWNGPQMVRLREDFLAHKTPGVCAACAHFASGTGFHARLSCLVGSERQKKNLEQNRAEFLAGSTILESLPLCLSLDLSYSCNFRCVLCSLRLQADALPPREVAEAFGEYSATALHLHVSGGEPLLSRDFQRYIEQATNLPGALSITTNGSRLDAAVLEQFERFPRVNLHISVDTFDPLLFGRLREGGELSAILDAVELAVRFKHRVNSRCGEARWYIALNLLPTALNVEEMPTFLRRAAELDVDGVDICAIDGDHPEHDFMRNPDLIAHLDARSLATAIRRTTDELPALEVGGLEPVVRLLESIVPIREVNA